MNRLYEYKKRTDKEIIKSMVTNQPWKVNDQKA